MMSKMKKASKEVIALIEETGSKIINWNYDGQGNDFTILMYVKKHATAEYEDPESTFKYFKENMRDMRFIKEARIKGVAWKEVWEYFKADDK